MERELIITRFVSDPEYMQICKHVGGDYAEDLYQELVLIVLELPEDKLQRLNDTCLKCFFVRMAQRQFTRRNATFYRKYRSNDRVIAKHREDILQACESTAVDPDLLDKLDRAMKETYWYDQGVFSLYTEMGTIREVSAKTGIPQASIAVTVREFKKIVQKKIKKYD